MLVKNRSPFNELFPSWDVLFGEYETVPTFKNNFIPATDVSENETEYEVALSVPGYAKSDFAIKIEEESLIVSGEKQKTEKKYNFKETTHDKFVRRFTLPKDVKVDSINATYVDGILTIKLPKDKAISTNKVIEVQ